MYGHFTNIKCVLYLDSYTVLRSLLPVLHSLSVECGVKHHKPSQRFDPFR